MSLNLLKEIIIRRMAKKRRSKKTREMGKIFHKKTEVDGIVFDSETESKYYEYIRDNKKALNIKEIELQPEFILQQKYILTPDGKRIDYIDDKQFKAEQKKYPKCTHQAIKYIADFKITYKDGTVDIIDVKGTKTADFKIKEKIFNYLYPEYKQLKCIALYKGEWLLWDEYIKRIKSNKK